MFRSTEQTVEAAFRAQGWGWREEDSDSRNRGLPLSIRESMGMSERRDERRDERIPAEVFPPGEYLADELETRGWTQTEFAEIIRRPLKVVNEIISGKKAITPDTAREFAAALGTSPQYWMNLESAYQLWNAKPATDIKVIEREAWLRD